MLTFFAALNPAIEEHSTGRMQWLRASVLGANDGLVSISSIMVGVAASGAGTHAAITAGVAGLPPGRWPWRPASTSRSAPKPTSSEPTARWNSATSPRTPRVSLRNWRDIYRDRGLPSDLATQVALALHEVDPLEAHLRDELGHTETSAARPVQAAVVSAGSYLSGGLIPFLGLLLADHALGPDGWRSSAVTLLRAG